MLAWLKRALLRKTARVCWSPSIGELLTPKQIREEICRNETIFAYLPAPQSRILRNEIHSVLRFNCQTQNYMRSFAPWVYQIVMQKCFPHYHILARDCFPSLISLDVKLHVVCFRLLSFADWPRLGAFLSTAGRHPLLKPVFLPPLSLRRRRVRFVLEAL